MIIGTSIANYHVATMDRDGRLQPHGATGELVIMGDGVGRGYIGREELTKRSFITLLGRRAYRSGDLVRICEDGKIEFHGRMDNLVKLHGLRIELGEIENVLNSYPGVRSSIVVVDRDAECLAAYFTADRTISHDDLKNHLFARLTAYMVPQSIRQLPEMPLTANGKINKKALPPIVQEKAERHIEHPVTDLQRQLCGLFRKALGIDEVGINENFFELGGTSLKASVMLMSVIQNDIPIVYKDIFDAPTVEALERIVLKKQGREEKGPETVEDAEMECLACNTNEHLDELTS